MSKNVVDLTTEHFFKQVKYSQQNNFVQQTKIFSWNNLPFFECTIWLNQTNFFGLTKNLSSLKKKMVWIDQVNCFLDTYLYLHVMI